MKKRMLAIVNPISGIGKQRRIETIFQKNLNHDLFDFKLQYTEPDNHGEALARKAADDGYDVIVAVGGDGTVNDVIRGMINSDSRLGIIPCGSGNGLARCLRIPLQPAFAVRVLNQYHKETIDTIVVNNQYIVASIAGVGFDAHIAQLMKQSKSRGLPAYVNLIVREYGSYQCKDYHLVIDDKEIDRNAWFIAIANSNQFGFNMAVAPHAVLDDGLIDISIVDKVPLEHVPITGPLIYANHFELSQHVEMFKAHEIHIYGNIDKWVNIDGEGMLCGNEIHFVNHQKSLKIIGRNPKMTLKEALERTF